MARDAYARIAPWYDVVLEPSTRALRSLAVKMAEPGPGDRVLDVGCGTGAWLEAFADGGARCSGIDASPAMLEVARKRLGDNADLTLGDAAQMPYPDGAFTVVAASMFLHELPSDLRSRILGEIARVLAPEGRVVVVDFGEGALTVKGRLTRALSMIAERIAGREHHRNCTTFLAQGGIPGSLSGEDLVVGRSRYVGGGNIGIFLLTHR